MIDESIVTDVTETVGDENGAEGVFADEFDAAVVDCDGGAGVVAAIKFKEKNFKICLDFHINLKICSISSIKKLFIKIPIKFQC